MIIEGPLSKQPLARAFVQVHSTSATSSATSSDQAGGIVNFCHENQIKNYSCKNRWSTSTKCLLYGSNVETIIHLFLRHSFTEGILFTLKICLNLCSWPPSSRPHGGETEISNVGPTLVGNILAHFAREIWKHLSWKMFP